MRRCHERDRSRTGTQYEAQLGERPHYPLFRPGVVEQRLYNIAAPYLLAVVMDLDPRTLLPLDSVTLANEVCFRSSMTYIMRPYKEALGTNFQKLTTSHGSYLMVAGSEQMKPFESDSQNS